VPTLSFDLDNAAFRAEAGVAQQVLSLWRRKLVCNGSRRCRSCLSRHLSGRAGGFRGAIHQCNLGSGSQGVSDRDRFSGTSITFLTCGLHLWCFPFTRVIRPKRSQTSSGGSGEPRDTPHFSRNA
jgi:hypothetical protein